MRGMSYVRLIPSMPEYSDRFKKLDPLDFKIIKAMYRNGTIHLSPLAETIGVPQQTVSYHVRKLDGQDLVRFRAVIDEAKLGLKSYVVIGCAPLGREDFSSRAMTCFPLWRYLAIVDGWKRGNYVRYIIPPDKERDLIAFLNQLTKREIIYEFEIFQTTSPSYPLLNLDFYAKREGIPMFDWDKWVKDFDSFPEEELIEPTTYEKAKFDLHDLIILRCLEINARTTQRKIVQEMARILREKEYKKFIPLVSRRIRDTIMPYGLVKSYRAYLFPHASPTALFLAYHLIFPNSSRLKRFLGGLNHLPFNTAYEKILVRDELFVRFIIPAHEHSGMRKSLTELAELGQLKDAHLLFGDLMDATWDNVEIYQMYKDETWNFSYGITTEMLENVLSHKRK